MALCPKKKLSQSNGEHAKSIGKHEIKGKSSFYQAFWFLVFCY